MGGLRRLGWLVVGLTLLVGCAQKVEPEPAADTEAPKADDTTPAPTPGRTLRFAVVPKQKDNPVFGYARRAAEARAKELGVELLWDAPAQNDEAKQAAVVEDFVAQGVDGIAVSCSNPETLKRAIDKAADAGIPVVTWDSDSPESKRKAFYGINDYETGKLLGKEMLALLPDGGTVALLSGVQGAQNLEERLRGAREVLAENPKIKVVQTAYCNDDLPKSKQAIDDVMTANPELGGWIMVGGWPLFVINGLEALTPGKTKVVAVDPLPEALHWLADGYVQVCVGQKVFGWGRESINMLYALANGKPIEGVDPQGFVDSGVDVVVKEKTGAYAGEPYLALADYQQQFEMAAGPSGG